MNPSASAFPVAFNGGVNERIRLYHSLRIEDSPQQAAGRFNKRSVTFKTFTICLFAVFAAGVLNAESSKERALEKFTCDGNFFTAMIPSDWEKAEEIILGRQEKRYGVDITAPETAEGAFINISLIYFGPDHILFKTYENYIVKNMKMPRKKKGEKTTGPVELIFDDRKAITFETERYESIPPGALTIVFSAANNVSPSLTAGSGKIGLRVSSHPGAQGIVHYLPSVASSYQKNIRG
jgi:hypothetical protein